MNRLVQAVKAELLGRELGIAILIAPDVDTPTSYDGEKILSDVELRAVNQKWKF